MTASHVCENLSPMTVNLLQEYLRGLGYSSGLEGVFWLPVPEKFLSAAQKEHAEQCGPYILALVFEDSSLSLEFLVRAVNALHCTCIGPASPDLRTFALNQLDSMLTHVNA